MIIANTWLQEPACHRPGKMAQVVKCLMSMGTWVQSPEPIFFLTEYDGIVRPALGKLGSLMVPWGSLACSPILLAKFQAIGSLVSKKEKCMVFEEGEPRLSSGFRMWPHAHTKPQHFKSCKSTAYFGFHTVPFPVAQSASGFSYPRGNMWLVPAHSCLWDWGFENRFCSFKDFSLP